MTVPAFRPDSPTPASDDGPARGPREQPFLGTPWAASVPATGTPEVAGDGSRFRRPERSATDGSGRDAASAGALDGEARPRVEGQSVDVLPSASLALSRGGGSPTLHGVSEPLAALAAAFQANAEALRRSHELQADLGRALQRADRSEVMVQNTAALNDTFKGLTQVQRSLVQSVDAADRATRAHRWFLPTLVLASLAVVGAGLWLVVTRLEEVETDVIGRGDIGTQLVAARREGDAAAREGLAESFATERRALEARLNDREEEWKTAKADAVAREAKVKQLETDLASASNEIQNARNDSLRARALEGELNQLRIEAAVKGPDAERLRLELEDEKRTVADLRRRIADLSMGRATAPDDAAPAPRSTTKDAPPADLTSGAEPVRDRRALEAARARLNDLLKTSAAGRADYVQVTSFGSVDGTRVADVTAVRYGAAGKIMSTYNAKDLRITVDRTRRIVELAFTDGTLDYQGSKVPFPGGALTVGVAEGDQISAWLRSGLTFVGSR